MWVKGEGMAFLLKKAIKAQESEIRNFIAAFIEKFQQLLCYSMQHFFLYAFAVISNNNDVQEKVLDSLTELYGIFLVFNSIELLCECREKFTSRVAKDPK